MVKYKDFTNTAVEHPTRTELRDASLKEMNEWLGCSGVVELISIESLSYTTGFGTHYAVEGFRVIYR